MKIRAFCASKAWMVLLTVSTRCLREVCTQTWLMLGGMLGIKLAVPNPPTVLGMPACVIPGKVSDRTAEFKGFEQKVAQSHFNEAPQRPWLQVEKRKCENVWKSLPRSFCREFHPHDGAMPVPCSWDKTLSGCILTRFASGA